MSVIAQLPEVLVYRVHVGAEGTKEYWKKTDDPGTQLVASRGLIRVMLSALHNPMNM